MPTTTLMAFVLDDGGREQAGFKGTTGDCVTRSIAIVTGKSYREVYDALHERTLANCKVMARLELRYGKNARREASPRTGVLREVYEPYLKEVCGLKWVPTMHIGQGCTTHLRADELPTGRLVVAVSKHVTAVIDGVIHDTYDPSRDGTRCVYGYYTATPPAVVIETPVYQFGIRGERSLAIFHSDEWHDFDGACRILGDLTGHLPDSADVRRHLRRIRRGDSAILRLGISPMRIVITRQ